MSGKIRMADYIYDTHYSRQIYVAQDFCLAQEKSPAVVFAVQPAGDLWYLLYSGPFPPFPPPTSELHNLAA